MNGPAYKYTFADHVPAEEAEATLLLSLLALEALRGESQVRLDAGHHFDPDRRACVIDAGTAVGRDLNRVFVGYLRREFGPDAFRVERVAAVHPPERRGTGAGRRPEAVAPCAPHPL
jgi:hypothetical protein